ncbi:MAG: TM2 domain-containing protein [Selenomonadaceae bacterium]|nr:TM2 domain-containing protein [Selenomonadaceae bacterium]
MYCKYCGKSIPDDANVCPYCGRDLVSEKKEPEEKIYYVSAQSRTKALILCLLGFVGLAGLHRFYVGKWLTGVLYLFTYGFFFFGTAYDLFKIWSESFKDSDGFPLYAESSMQKNYRRRTTKPSSKGLMWVGILFSILFFAGLISFIAYKPDSQVANIETSQTSSGSQSEQNKKEQKKEKSELEFVQEIRDNYVKGEYSKAQGAFVSLKKQYPDSQYIAQINMDYPDLDEKGTRQAKEKKAQAEQEVKEAAERFNNTMSNNELSPIYAGYRGDWRKFSCYVNSGWYNLTDEQKKAYTEITYKIFTQCGLSAPLFYIVHRETERNLAHYNQALGRPSLD